VIEASTSPDQVEEFFTEVMQLLAAQARRIDAAALQRARNQLAVRSLRARERAARRLETAALDLFVHGHVRAPAHWLQRLEAVTAYEVREAFERMLAAPPALALAGRIGRRAGERVPQIVAAAGAG
jgi:predicted Zn-dependent peptidase